MATLLLHIQADQHPIQDRDIMSAREAIDELLELKKKAFKGKEMALGEQAKKLDPFTMYTKKSPNMGKLMLHRLRAQTLLAWMLTPPMDKLGAFLAEGLVFYHESGMARDAAVPDVLVDEEDGDWNILSLGKEGGQIGLNDLPQEEGESEEDGIDD